MKKEWYRDKKVWFAVLFVLLSIAAVFGYNDWQPPEDLQELVAIIQAILLLLLKYAKATIQL